MRSLVYVANAPVRLLHTYFLFLCILYLAGQNTYVFAQSVDPTLTRTPAFQLEHFEALGDSTKSHFNLSGAEVQAHRVFTGGLLCNYSNNPAIIEPEGGVGGAIFRDVTRCDVLASIGLFDRGSLSIALPMALSQSGERLEVLNLNDQQIEGAQLGDLRLTPKVRLFDRNSLGFAAALLTPVHFPTGDGTSLNSAGGLQVGARIALDWVFHDWQILANLGYRLLNPLQLHNVIFDDSTRWGFAIKTPSLGPDLFFSTSVYGNQSSADSLNPRDLSQSQDDQSNDPIETLSAVTWRPKDKEFDLKLGLGFALNKGLGAAQWRALAGIDWRPKYSATALPNIYSGLPRLPIDFQAIIYAPSFTGVSPFINRRVTAPDPESLLTINTATVGKPADLAFKLEIGQASASGDSFIADALYTSLHVTWAIIEDLQLSVEIPSIVGGQDFGQPIDALTTGAVEIPVAMSGATQSNAMMNNMMSSSTQLSQTQAQAQALGLGDLRLQIKTLAINAANKELGAGLVIPITLPTATLAAYGRDRMRIGSMAVSTWHLKNLDISQNTAIHIEDNLASEIPLSAIVEAGVSLRGKLSNSYKWGLEAFSEQPIPRAQRQTPEIYGGGLLMERDRGFGLLWGAGLRAQMVGDYQQIDLVYKMRWRGYPDSKAEIVTPVVIKPRVIVEPKPKVVPPPKPKPEPITKPKVIDQDGDEVPDHLDQCPQEKEDKDGYQDQDGCPEPDNDEDQVPDELDRCPLVRGIRAWDGCNDKVIQVQFESGEAELINSSMPALEEIAQIIKTQPEIMTVVIQGHTDDTGQIEKNQQLSVDRANTVKSELIRRKVKASLLFAVGLASTQPLVSTKGLQGLALKKARAQNRRVVFILSFSDDVRKSYTKQKLGSKLSRASSKQSSKSDLFTQASKVSEWGATSPSLDNADYPYSVLISSFKSVKYAQRLANQIKNSSAKMKPWLYTIDLGAKGKRYRVLIGQFKRRSQAQAILPILKPLKLKPRLVKWTKWAR